jgi:hypothetical protein
MYNLRFEEFISQVVIPTTPEDQRDSCWFELVDWVMNGFRGIPSTELQRLIDQEITAWLQSFNIASILAENLFNMNSRQALWAGSVAARYAVEKAWQPFSTDKRPMEAVQTVEFHLKTTNGHVFNKSLINDGSGAWSAASFIRIQENYMYEAAMAPYRISYAAYWENDKKEFYEIVLGIEDAATATSDEEICKVIVEKMPRIHFEDLLRWEYFRGKRFTV